MRRSPYLGAAIRIHGKTWREGRRLAYCTYLGGSQNDSGYGIAVDASGNAYATGYTQSTDLPVTPSALQTTNGGGLDAFVARLNAAGTKWGYVTYLGGSRDEYGYAIAVDSAGDAFVRRIHHLGQFSAYRGAPAHLYRARARFCLGLTPKAPTGRPPMRDLANRPTIMGAWSSTRLRLRIYWLSQARAFSTRAPIAAAPGHPIVPWPESISIRWHSAPLAIRVYAGTFDSVYASTDSGNTWTFAGNLPYDPFCASLNLTVDPTSPTTVYAGGGAIFSITSTWQ